ncbi:FAD binding domain-containing protein [Neorhizobium vignae]|uniref:FAD binding domain-containing protein n=1 Tax=Neorhizobium vignae TaxID=690585 RepID=UPI00056AE185|nr:xanthine dehydrogenase family protein subunit M [Neorhizobium vignae]
MKARAFDYMRPKCVQEALEAFVRADGDASYIAGGQSLVPALALRLQAPGLLIDIARLDELRGLSVAGGHLRIGATTRHCEILGSDLVREHAPLLARAAPFVAHPAIRNKGTFGGSLALADPASEFPAMALALDAIIEIASVEGSRRVGAGDFFIDLYETALQPGEIITAVYVPLASAKTRTAFDELARRRGDYAIVGAGIDAEMQGGFVERMRIAFLSVGSTPVRVGAVEAALTGRQLTPQAIRQAQDVLGTELDPVGDEHTPPEMRRHLARVLLGRLLGRLEANV